MSRSRRPGTPWSRRVSDALRHPPPGAAAVTIAMVSTVIVLTVVGLIIVNSPGWSRVQETFFDGEVFMERFPQILRRLPQERRALRVRPVRSSSSAG